MNNDVNNGTGVNNIPDVNADANKIPVVNPVASSEDVSQTVSPVGTTAGGSVQGNGVVGNPTPISNPNPVVPQNVVNSDVQNSGGSTTTDNAILNENLKKVEINYTPPSKFKVFLMILFFVFLLGFVIFLPDITSMIGKYKAEKNNKGTEKITTGKMICTLKNSTTNLDKEYELIFSFTDNKLEKLNFSISTRGDPTADEETLDKLAATCKQLSESADHIKGIDVRCDYTNGKLVEQQKFDLANMDAESVNEAFIEAGGNNPEYSFGQDVDKIERTMNASGYTCHRE